MGKKRKKNNNSKSANLNKKNSNVNNKTKQKTNKTYQKNSNNTTNTNKSKNKNTNPKTNKNSNQKANKNVNKNNNSTQNNKNKTQNIKKKSKKYTSKKKYVNNYKTNKSNLNENKKIEKQEEKKLPNENSIPKEQPKNENIKNDENTINIFYSLIIAIFCIIVFFAELFILNILGNKIQKNIYIEDIDISRLTFEEAKAKVKSKYDNTGEKKIKCYYNENNYEIDLNDLGFKYLINDSIQEAFYVGRNRENVVESFIDFYSLKFGNVKNINLKYEYNKGKLKQKINQIEKNFSNEVKQYSYSIQDDFLVISNGKDGIKINSEEFEKQIKEMIRENNFEKIIEIPIYIEKAEEIDVDKIHDQIYTQMQNAYYTIEPFEIHNEIRGIDFDSVQLKEIIKNSPENEEYSINLIYTEPEVRVDDLDLYKDTLGTCSTNYVNNPNRTTNLRLAASKINGKILMPGESFSYNDVVGERTVAAGYRNAAIYVNGEVEDGLAGGICQISSTLYDAVVYANLEVNERYNHARVPSYLSAGRDATVYWGSKDFKFTNNRSYPIKISMEVSNGRATAIIYGKRTDNEYDISFETTVVSRYNGRMVVNAYKVYRQNGVVVNKELLSTDSYKI